MKMLAILLIISALGSGVYYVVDLAQERERLAAGLDTATSANKTYIAAMVQMETMWQQSQQQVAERDQRNADIERRLRARNQELNNARQSSNITTTQRECMDSAIPRVIADILREHSASGHRDRPAAEAVSRLGAVLNHAAADVRGPHLDRPRELYAHAAVGIPEITVRPPGNTGFLR